MGTSDKLHPEMSVPPIYLFTDGSFEFGRRAPGFGWVAATPDNRVLDQGSGTVADDGTRTFAGEAGAVLAALGWAVAAGYRTIYVHTDLESLARHFFRDRERGSHYSRRLFAFRQAHPEVELVVRKVSSAEPLLEKAHHLARAAMCPVDRDGVAELPEAISIARGLEAVPRAA